MAKTSDIWKHFQICGNGAKCLHCKIIMTHTNGSTSNLKRHMIRKHPFVRTIKKNRCKPSTASPAASLVPEETVYEIETVNTFPQFFQTDQPMSTPSEEKLDSMLLLMLCKEYYPFSIVEDVYFKQFVHGLNPDYQLPSKSTLYNTALPRLYNATLNVVKEKLESASSVSLTTDCWTGTNNTSYCALTAHFICKDSISSSYLLECTDLADRHTAKNLASWIRTVCENYAIGKKIFTLVSDNATYMRSTADCLGVFHLSCCAHTLNLIVQTAIEKSIKKIVEDVKDMVIHIRKSSVATSKLIEMQINMNQPQLKLKQNCPTRWNSTYDMLNRFIKNRIPVVSCLAAINFPYTLQENDWTVIEQACNILEVINGVTNAIMGEKIVTVSKMGVLIRSMETKLREKKENLQLNFQSVDLLNGIISGIREGFKTIYESEIVSSAMILDPRFKKKGFLGDDHQFESAYEKLVTKMIPFQRQDMTDNDQQSNEDDEIWEILNRHVQRPQGMSTGCQNWLPCLNWIAT